MIIKRFTDMEDIVRNNSEQLGSVHMISSEQEIFAIKDLVHSFTTIEIGSRALDRRDCTLGKADVIFKFILEDISSGRRFTCVHLRYHLFCRRDPCISRLYVFLENPEEYHTILMNKTSSLEYP